MEPTRDAVDLVDASTVVPFARATLVAVMLGASAYVAIPLPVSPVPVTLQVLVVFLAGLYLGPTWGGFAVALYLVAGTLGLPVFAGGSAGIGVLVGQTGGYLAGYLVAAVLIGALVHGVGDRRDPATASTPVLVLSLVAGLALVYGMGAAYMAWVLALDGREAIALGVVPFLPGDVLKLVAAVAIVRSRAIVVERA